MIIQVSRVGQRAASDTRNVHLWLDPKSESPEQEESEGSRQVEQGDVVAFRVKH